MNLTVVIPVRDDSNGLRSALAGLRRQSQAAAAVLLVNSGDTPLPADTSEGLVVRELRVGPAMPGRARNLGAQAAQTEWLAFLDAGTEPLPTWIAAFLEAAEATTDVEVLFGSYAPRIRDDWDWAAVATYLAPPNTALSGRTPTTASLCIRRDTWQRLGGMREDLRAGEDLLFFDCVAASGARTAIVPGAQVTWDLPSGHRGHFQRLRSYSRATWPTPLASRWQRPVMRMYLAGALASAVSLVAYPPLVGLVGLLMVARLAKAIVQRRPGLPSPWTPSRLARIPAMLAIADLASLLGVVDAVASGLRPRPNRS